ncbi:MAG: hypothetical protein P1P84_01610 [Deferrisomatales bacterium]|nr:hypothetical protein [Deferrisomatales bacterium]
MAGRKGLCVGALVAALAGWNNGASAAEAVLHLIHIADVRGTVGMCG